MIDSNDFPVRNQQQVRSEMVDGTSSVIFDQGVILQNWFVPLQRALSE